MRPWWAYLAAGGIVTGIALVVASVLQGTAQASIVLIVPVLSGSSPEFVLGTLLTVVGVIGLLLSAAGVEVNVDGDRSAATRSGGLILIGPVPIFFGAWARSGRRAAWRWVAAGLIATAILVLIVVAWWVRG